MDMVRILSESMGIFDKRIWFGLSIAVVGLAYYLRPVFPDSASNHGLKIFIGFSHRFIETVGAVGSTFGFSSINITRNLLDMLNIERKSDLVEEIKTFMDGVEVTIFKPSRPYDDLRPGIIHFHGGGWIFFSPDIYAPVCRALVVETQSILISVNYRLAPEHVFPAAINDCLKATRYFLKNAAKYGVDKNRVGVKGDSAGGNLAMAAALALSKETDQDIPKLKFMSLDYPALQAFDFKNLPAHNKYRKGPGFLQTKMLVEFWLYYAFGNTEHLKEFLQNEHTSDVLKMSKYAEYVNVNLLPTEFRRDMKNNNMMDKSTNKKGNSTVEDIILNPQFAPLMASDEDLSRLPSTYIMNAEFDVLRDDGFLAAQRLRNVGVPVEHNHITTEEHSFLNFVEIDQYAKDEMVNFAKFFNKTMT